MVGHQAIPEQSNRMPLVRLEHDLLKREIVGVLAENPHSADGAIENMVDDPSRCSSGAARHGGFNSIFQGRKKGLPSRLFLVLMAGNKCSRPTYLFALSRGIWASIDSFLWRIRAPVPLIFHLFS